MDFQTLLELGDTLKRGKTTSDNVSLNQDIAEAQAADEMSRQPRTNDTPMTRAEQVARAKAGIAQRSAENAQKVKQYGTTDTAQIQQVEGKGPFNKGFSQLAAGDPLRASQELDTVESVLGLRGGAAGPDAPIYRGTAKAHDGSGEDIPYFTNIPGTPEGVSNLERYQPGGKTSGLGGGVETDPAKRAVAERIALARQDVKYGEKTPDAVGREVAGRYDAAVKDIKTMGMDAASKKWLDDVSAGTLSDAAYKRLHVEAADTAAKQDEAEYGKIRAAATSVARDEGVSTALRQLQNNRLAGSADPKHLRRVEIELRSRARPATSTEMLLTPDLYLPASKTDAAQLRNRAPGAVVDKTAPPSLINPHDGKTSEQIANAGANDTISGLIGAVTGPAATGATARDAASYTAAKNGLPGSMAGDYMAQHLADLRGEKTAAQQNRENLPSTDDIMAWLEGGGNIERGRKTRKRLGKSQ